MTLDRYTKVVLTVIAIALVALAVNLWIDKITPTRAEAQTSAAKYELSLPKAWGKIVGFSNQNLLMEASDGTLRAVDVEGKAPEFPRVKVQMKWQ